MAYTTIDDPFKHFNTKIYTGTGSSNALTGVGFQPDWVWIKDRDSTENHNIFDTVRTATKRISSNRTNAEDTQAQQLTAFGSDGFTVGTDSGANHSGRNYVSWNWLAGGTASSNSDGSITSSVSANTTAGFSIVSYTGTGSNATVGHGLGSAPSFVIIKDRGNSISWVVSGDNIGWNKNVYLDSTQAVQTANHFQDTAPTSSLMYLSTDAAVNGSSRNYIMYCFAEKKGYSKFGSYTGNGVADGTFVYTGFKPAWVMIKRSDVANDWNIQDNKRTDYNGKQTTSLRANTSESESTVGTDFRRDILSNGFKIRNGGAETNESGGTFIYMAFAENPFVTSGTKAAGTAR